MYSGINPESGFDAIYALAPTYHASKPERREGGYGAWNTADLRVPLFATGEEVQELVEASVHEYFGEEKAPRISVIVKGASHYTMKNFFFSSMWMTMFFQLYLKGDRSVVPALWGPRTMEGALAGDRDAISMVRRSQIGLAINADVVDAPWGGETYAYRRAVATNRRDTRPASVCVVDADTGAVLDAVHLEREQAKEIVVPDGAGTVALMDLEDFTTLYAVKGMNF